MALAALAVLCTTACTQDESIEQKCERLRDHVVDLRTEGLPAADVAAHRSALKNALGDQFTEECKSMTPKQIDCGLAADEISLAAACAAR
jgi:hypothetical protein